MYRILAYGWQTSPKRGVVRVTRPIFNFHARNHISVTQGLHFSDVKSLGEIPMGSPHGSDKYTWGGKNDEFRQSGRLDLEWLLPSLHLPRPSRYTHKSYMMQVHFRRFNDGVCGKKTFHVQSVSAPRCIMAAARDILHADETIRLSVKRDSTDAELAGARSFSLAVHPSYRPGSALTLPCRVSMLLWWQHGRVRRNSCGPRTVTDPGGASGCP